MITLTLTTEEAAEVHTYMDSAARDCMRQARRMRSLPIVSRMFSHAAERCSAVAQKIEAEIPEFRDLAERVIAPEPPDPLEGRRG